MGGAMAGLAPSGSASDYMPKAESSQVAKEIMNRKACHSGVFRYAVGGLAEEG